VPEQGGQLNDFVCSLTYEIADYLKIICNAYLYNYFDDYSAMLDLKAAEAAVAVCFVINTTINRGAGTIESIPCFSMVFYCTHEMFSCFSSFQIA